MLDALEHMARATRLTTAAKRDARLDPIASICSKLECDLAPADDAAVARVKAYVAATNHASHGLPEHRALSISLMHACTSQQ